MSAEQLTLFCMCRFGVTTSVVEGMNSIYWMQALVDLEKDRLIEFSFDDERWRLTAKGKQHFNILRETPVNVHN